MIVNDDKTLLLQIPHLFMNWPLFLSRGKHLPVCIIEITFFSRHVKTHELSIKNSEFDKASLLFKIVLYFFNSFKS